MVQRVVYLLLFVNSILIYLNQYNLSSIPCQLSICSSCERHPYPADIVSQITGLLSCYAYHTLDVDIYYRHDMLLKCTCKYNKLFDDYLFSLNASSCQTRGTWKTRRSKVTLVVRKIKQSYNESSTQHLSWQLVKPLMYMYHYTQWALHLSQWEM